MPREFRHNAHFIERIPTPDEIDQKNLGPLLLKQVQEMREEIDAIWAYLKEDLRAAEPWESEDELRAHEKRKEEIKTRILNLGLK